MAPRTEVADSLELSPSEGGGWTETVLYHFGHGNSDGAFPYSGLIMDGAGNLYAQLTTVGTPVFSVVAATAERCSNCRPSKAAVGEKRNCIPSGMAVTEAPPAMPA